jgi:hypothetical protein
LIVLHKEEKRRKAQAEADAADAAAEERRIQEERVHSC